MSNELERAKINLENLRNELAKYTRDRDHAINLIELRKRDIERAELHLQNCRYPIYDNHSGVPRRVVSIDAKFITLRWDAGRRQIFRRSDGAPKKSHTKGERINLSKAITLWNDYVATQTRPALGRAGQPA